MREYQVVIATSSCSHNQFSVCVPEKPECPLHLYFVIDTSETIALQEPPPGSLVTSISRFTELFVQQLEDIDYRGLVQINWRIGGLHFSQTQEMFSPITDKNDFLARLRGTPGRPGIRYLGKGTYIDCALTNMTDQIRRSGEPSLRYAVVITDGHVTGNPCGGIKKAAEHARDMGIRLFSVAASHNIDEAGLREIANSPVGLFRNDYLAVNITASGVQIVERTYKRIIQAMVRSHPVLPSWNGSVLLFSF